MNSPTKNFFLKRLSLLQPSIEEQLAATEWVLKKVRFHSFGLSAEEQRDCVQEFLSAPFTTPMIVALLVPGFDTALAEKLTTRLYSFARHWKTAHYKSLAQLCYSAELPTQEDRSEPFDALSAAEGVLSGQVEVPGQEEPSGPADESLNLWLKSDGLWPHHVIERLLQETASGSTSADEAVDLLFIALAGQTVEFPTEKQLRETHCREILLNDAKAVSDGEVVSALLGKTSPSKGTELKKRPPKADHQHEASEASRRLTSARATLEALKALITGLFRG